MPRQIDRATSVPKAKTSLPRVVVVVGPTSSGKTGLSLRVARCAPAKKLSAKQFGKIVATFLKTPVEKAFKGEKKEEREEKTENMHRIERSFGSFSRSVTLPCEVKEDLVEASFKNGVLNLKLPKAESTKKRSIKIDVK